MVFSNDPIAGPSLLSTTFSDAFGRMIPLSRNGSPTMRRGGDIVERAPPYVAGAAGLSAARR
jgi:hypothetical protein